MSRLVLFIFGCICVNSGSLALDHGKIEEQLTSQTIVEAQEEIFAGGRYFIDAILDGMSFHGMDLRGIRIVRSSAKEANFSSARMMQTVLRHTDFSGATMIQARLTGADLRGSNFQRANFSGADLREAYLQMANFQEAHLEAANFTDAKVDGCLFEPHSLPPPSFICLAKGLENLAYKDNPMALITLRNQLLAAGYERAARKVNYALQRGKTEKMLQSGRAAPAILRYILLDWTCGYGLYPFRPVVLFIVIIAIFAVLYMLLFDKYQKERFAIQSFAISLSCCFGMHLFLRYSLRESAMKESAWFGQRSIRQFYILASMQGLVTIYLSWLALIVC